MKKKMSGVPAIVGYNLVILVIIGIIIGKTIATQVKIQGEEALAPVYEKHYALISADTDDEFWTKVYESAKEKAAEQNAYVEWFGKNLSVNYSVNELARMAMNAGVDGIIMPATDDDESKSLINTIVGSGIPVVTALSDCHESMRQSYVGVNNYDIGQMYGERVKELVLRRFRKNIRVMTVVSGDHFSNSQNLIQVGIREYLGANLPGGYIVQYETELIDQSNTFATEEFFNNLFISNATLPDILICLDEKGTRCAYRASVDHNRVGDSMILGFYYTKDILSALEKEILDSVMAVDADEIGKGTVDALADYQEYGYSNSYSTVTIQLLGQAEAASILQRETEEMPVEVKGE